MYQTPKGKYCDEKTAKELERYWEMRERDLRAMYLTDECSIEELEEFLESEGVNIEELRSEASDEDEYRGILEEEAYEQQYDYGLGIDIVEPCTFKDQPEPYLRYQFSWGGGQDEIRFYFDETGEFYSAEYWYLDWGTGCYIDITHTDLAETIWSRLSEIMYEQIREVIQKMQYCEVYDGCDPEYVPDECKDFESLLSEMMWDADEETLAKILGEIEPFNDIMDILEEMGDEGDIPKESAEKYVEMLENGKNNGEKLSEVLLQIFRDAKRKSIYEDIRPALIEEAEAVLEILEDSEMEDIYTYVNST